MIAGFGSGAAFSLVSGMTTGNPFQTAFSTGVLFAVLQGAFYQVRVACQHSVEPITCKLHVIAFTTLGIQINCCSHAC